MYQADRLTFQAIQLLSARHEYFAWIIVAGVTSLQ